MRLFLSWPKQLDPEPAPADDVQARCRRIRIDVSYPHHQLTITLPPSPCLSHLPGLPNTFFPHDSITSFIEACTTDFAVVAPSGALGGDNIGAELFDDAVMFDGLDPFNAATSDLVDDRGGGIGHVKAPWTNDEKGIAVLSEEGVEVAIRPEDVEDADHTPSASSRGFLFVT